MLNFYFNIFSENKKASDGGTVVGAPLIILRLRGSNPGGTGREERGEGE